MLVPQGCRSTLMKNLRLVLLLAALLPTSQGLNVSYIIPESTWTAMVAEASVAPRDPVECAVAVRPYTVWSPAPDAPRTSPNRAYSAEGPPAFFVAQITFTFTSSGTANVSTPWQLQIQSPSYAAVLTVRPASCHLLKAWCSAADDICCIGCQQNVCRSSE